MRFGLPAAHGSSLCPVHRYYVSVFWMSFTSSRTHSHTYFFLIFISINRMMWEIGGPCGDRNEPYLLYGKPLRCTLSFLSDTNLCLPSVPSILLHCILLEYFNKLITLSLPLPPSEPLTQSSVSFKHGSDYITSKIRSFNWFTIL